MKYSLNALEMGYVIVDFTFGSKPKIEPEKLKYIELKLK